MWDYRGIVILKTNRASSLDDGIISRITLAAVFTPLSVDARQQIGMRLLKSATGELYVSLDARKAWERWLKSSDWSGHDIKSSKYL